MKLAGFDDESIRKMGRWLPSLNDFSEYIQQQLSGFSQGMATKACVHHVASEGQIIACPVKALARRVAHIWVHTWNDTTVVCAYLDSVGRGDVIDSDMSFHMKFAA